MHERVHYYLLPSGFHKIDRITCLQVWNSSFCCTKNELNWSHLGSIRRQIINLIKKCFDTLLTSFVKWTDALSCIAMIGVDGCFKTNSMYFFSLIYIQNVYLLFIQSSIIQSHWPSTVRPNIIFVVPLHATLTIDDPFPLGNQE